MSMDNGLFAHLPIVDVQASRPLRVVEKAEITQAGNNFVVYVGGRNDAGNVFYYTQYSRNGALWHSSDMAACLGNSNDMDCYKSIR